MESFTIKNKNGIEVTAIELGASLTSIRVPDRHGKFQNIILAYPTLEEYQSDAHYMGCVVGRYAGRIAAVNNLAKNDGDNHLHGGHVGWNKKHWNLACHKNTREESFFEFSLVSPDGDEGYPGEVAADVRYTLDHENRLTIKYRATSSKPTNVNLTQHCYFNLSGDPSSKIENDELQIFSNAYLPLNPAKIPTGEISSATFKGSPLGGRPIDQTWVLENDPKKVKHAATLFSKESGRLLNVYTSEPSIHIYTGNPSGVCLETQHYPDSPNQPHFPSTKLNPGETFESETVWEFKSNV